MLDEVSSKSIVASYGIAVPKGVSIRTADDVALAVQALRPPWVLKVMSPEIIHKTEVGGVCTKLTDATEVVASMASMSERVHAHGGRVDGFLIEEMAPAGLEVVIGGVRDRSFGWLVMFGLGGVFVEFLKDVAFRICPINAIDAVEMIHELRTAPLLSGARGGVHVQESALVDALLAVGDEQGLLLECGDQIAELDLNPLIASEGAVIAVDARFILAHE